MNSAYGKTIMEDIKTTNEYIPNELVPEYFDKKYNLIQDIYSVYEEQSMVKLKKGTIHQFRNCLLGTQILSISKRIMNEVMCLAEDIGISIYYQDTDLVHIPRDDVSLLANAFKNKYNTELIGNQLGQFHSGFLGTNADGSEVYAVESYFIWKKAYIDKLSNGLYHIRLNGTLQTSIELVIERSFGGDALALYEHLLEGHDVVFDLFETGVRFSLSPGSITSKNKFTRKVSFRQ